MSRRRITANALLPVACALLGLTLQPRCARAAESTTPSVAADLARLRVAPGLHVHLWASEPLVQDVTSLAFDAHGRALVVESGRRRTSVFDVRNLQPWLDDDYALRSVADREAFLRRNLTPGTRDYPAFVQALAKSKFGDFNRDGVIDAQDLTVEQERVRLVWDSDADGVADQARTFADGFNGLTSGVAAGILTRGPDVWFTCVPDLWRLPAPAFPAKETAALNPASPEVQKLLTGFGVHVAFGGHDLHGLLLGPDRRLYFSIADRGTSVTQPAGHLLHVPDSGAIFRCEPDGSGLEIVATGLRNPQELAFDDLGDLYTGDNNGDGGDKARWTRVIEGADYGWTLGWQWLPRMGAWNSERLWHTRDRNSAAYLVPPIAHIGHGPAGIAHYPGTGLSDAFLDHFVMADFPGGIRSFRVEPDGAFHRIADAGRWMEDNAATNITGKILWNLAPVDVAFPPGGGLIVADAFPSWEKTGRARLWKVTNPAAARDPRVAEVARLLREGFSHRPAPELITHLAHPDQRIRLEAQWALAEAGATQLPLLTRTALAPGPARLRVHALWAIGQIARRAGLPPGAMTTAARELQPLLEDPEPRIRETVLHTLAAARPSFLAAPALLARAADPHPRVVAAALRAGSSLLAFLPPEVSLAPDGFLNALTRGHETDPVIREARVTAVTRLDTHAGQSDARWARMLETSAAPHARLVALLSRRRRHDPAVARHLNDPHPVLVLEAARAIHDLPIPDALPALARLASDRSALDAIHAPGAPWPGDITFTRGEWRTWILRRAANAAFRLGGTDHARALASLATKPSTPETVRIEALDALAEWPAPRPRDRIVGLHRPLPPRDPAPARDALTAAWPDLTGNGTPIPVLLACLRAGAVLRPNAFGPSLTSLARHPAQEVRAEATRLSSLASPPTIPELLHRLEVATLTDRREALAQLATSGDPRATDALALWLERLNRGSVPPELHLDILDATTRHQSHVRADRLATLLLAWTNALPAGDPMARHRPALLGGDPVRGRTLFAERADWGCQRCHKLHGEGGDVGPELTGIGRTRGREHILVSILHPNQAIAPGYENVVLTLADGSTVGGTVKSETPDELVVDTGEDGRVTLAKTAVRTRQRGLSAMVEGLADLMTPQELRDLIAALTE